MEREVILRAATPHDIEAILAVQRASPGAGAWEATDYGDALSDEGTFCLLAEDQGREGVAGFLVGRTIADELEILNLAVARDFRRRGIGRRLVADALERAQGHGVGKCWLEVRAANRAAREFYRALGFAENSRRRRYYRDPEDDAIVCVRQLAAAGPVP